VDWNRPTEALMPGLEGVVMSVLMAVNVAQSVGDVHSRGRTGSRNGVRYALDKLVDQGVVTKTAVANTAIYELNTDHLAYPAIKAAFDTYQPYAELRRRLHDLVAGAPWSGAPAPTLLLYGSVARGSAGTDSDVDLLLVIPDDHDPDEPSVDGIVEQLHTKVPSWTGNRAHVDVRTRSAVAAAAASGDPIVESWRRDGDIVFASEPVAGLMR